MIIRVSELDEQGLTIDDPTALAFSDPAWRLERVHLDVTRDGADVLVQGRLVATVPQTCSRCVETFPAQIEADVDVHLEPRPAGGDSVELGAADLDVDFYEDDTLDLRRLVENEATLAIPMKALCRDDCRGLCPACGGNRNVTACACQARPLDPRLAVLADKAARLTN